MEINSFDKIDKQQIPNAFFYSYFIFVKATWSYHWRQLRNTRIFFNWYSNSNVLQIFFENNKKLILPQLLYWIWIIAIFSECSWTVEFCYIEICSTIIKIFVGQKIIQPFHLYSVKWGIFWSICNYVCTPNTKPLFLNTSGQGPVASITTSSFVLFMIITVFSLLSFSICI